MNTKSSRPKKNLKKIIVFYHGDCSDGFGGAWAAWKKFGNKANYIPLFRDKPLPGGLKNKEIYFIDFTPNSAAEIRRLIRDNARVTCIDHHITVKSNVNLTHKHLFALNHSGAVLAWQYFHPSKRVPVILQYVENRDIWRWKLPMAKEITEYMDMFDFGFSEWSRMEKDLESARKKEYIQGGRLLLRYKTSLIESISKNAELVNFDGKTIYAINSPHDFASELGYLLSVRRSPFAVIWNKESGLIKVSLRSIGDFDVAKLAQKFGGGGHKHSAGFSFSFKNGFPWKFLK